MKERNTKKRFFILLVVLCCAAYFILSIYFSYNHLVTRSYDITSDKVGQEIHLVVLADLHDNELGDGNSELIGRVQQLEPDAILMVGDMLNDVSACSDVAVDLVEQLSVDTPVYYALGNHEIGYGQLQDQTLISELEAAGAVILDLESQDIQINDQRIRIGGMYDYAFALDGYDSCDPKKMKPEVYSFLTEFQDTEDFTLMMAHRPESFVLGEASVTWDIDLVVSGHAHGGQVVVPFAGGLWAPEQGFFPEYVHGVYVKEQLRFVITSGLGSDPQFFPRFNNPPEIVEIVIKPQ